MRPLLVAAPLAALRVLVARWSMRRMQRAPGLHLVPLDGPGAGAPITDRPSLCGAPVASSGDATVQPSIVGCWGCALAIERDPERWDPRPKRKASTEHGMTVCLTCGGVDGYPPGCRCER